MNYKITNTLKKSKTVFIILIVLWVILSIVFVTSVARSIVEGTTNRSIFFWRFYRKVS